MKQAAGNLDSPAQDAHVEVGRVATSQRRLVLDVCSWAKEDTESAYEVPSNKCDAADRPNRHPNCIRNLAAGSPDR